MESSFTAIRKQREGSSAALRMDEHRTMLLTLIEEGLQPELCRLYLVSLAEEAGMQVPAPSQSYENMKGQAGGAKRRGGTVTQNQNNQRKNVVNIAVNGNLGVVKRDNSVSNGSGGLQSPQGSSSAKLLRGQSEKKAYDDSLKNQA